MHPKIAIAIPNTATFCSLTLGVLSIILMNERQFLLAAGMIGLASICDGLDGELATRLHATSSMGKELDSLADLVTFGVAPGMMIYHLLLLAGMERLLAIPIALVFIWAGAFRLARYNVLASDRRAYFIGMPIPAASYLLVTGAFWQHWTAPVWWTAAVFIASFLMISPFPYPKFPHLLHARPWIWLLGIVVIAGCWLCAGWQALPFSGLALYALIGPALWTAKRLRRRPVPAQAG